MVKRIIVMCMVLALSASGVMAGAAVGVKIGTLGLGAEATLGLTEKTNLRIGINSASIDLSALAETDDEVEDAEEIELTLDLSSVAALFDWHCFGGSFRLTGGALLNNNEATMEASVDESVEIGDSTYTVSSLDGTVSFGDIAPYIGIGFGNAVDEEGRLTFAFDLGIMFQGSPEVEITATASNPALQNALNADLDKEAQTIEDDTEGLTIYPVISLGLAYSF